MKNFAVRLYLITILLLLKNLLFSQANNYENDPYKNWDGHTHWSRNMRYSSKYFGPNALPVPDVKKGAICENIEISVAGEFHYNKLDPTTNIFTRVEIPIVKKRVNLELYVVPLEFYNTDTSLRIERRTLNKSGSGVAGGDVYVVNNIQISREKKKIPDIALRLGLRTASGTNLSHARYTDAPGYFFDISFGKKILIRKKNENTLKFYGSGGFYCWQTNANENRQNDAYMFSFGTDLNLKKTMFSVQIASYRGYLNNGDKPLVIRSAMKYLLNESLSIESNLESGIHDFDYTSLRLGILYQIKSLKKDIQISE